MFKPMPTSCCQVLSVSLFFGWSAGFGWRPERCLKIELCSSQSQHEKTDENIHHLTSICSLMTHEYD